jgi:flagellin
MALTINTNSAATSASLNLNSSNQMLQRSLNRLSSGNRIVNPADDAGGLAVSMKMSAAVKRTDAVNNNVQNAVSFLQTQDGALKTSATILDRISELRTLNNDVTKNDTDKANYNTEFTQLKSQLTSLQAESFNGVSLFGGSSATKSVAITEGGDQSVTISQSDLATAITNVSAAASLSAVSVAQVTGSIQSVATLRATNGAQTSRLQFASQMLDINKTNLEAANSRIIDTDIASESTNFAKYQILAQAGAAMLAQANSSSQVALRLLG